MTAGAKRGSATETVGARLLHFLTPFDGRYEDLRHGSVALNVMRDLTAGLIVAMVAIPLAMGFAMASGLPPEMGIVGGAVAGLVGALFGGSKYQVYGPTAAFIPVILAITTKYPDGNFLIWCGLLSGVLLLLLGVARLGRIVALVPNSIVVGFTIGIAVVIAASQLEQVAGLKTPLPYGLLSKLRGLTEHFGEINLAAVGLALLTFAVTRVMLRMSKYAPAPLIAVGLATILSATVLSGAGLTLIKDKYGAIPADLLRLTPPAPLDLSATVAMDLVYFVLAIVFVSGVESLLCSRMADRLAGNKGTPFDPNKELWGQGMVQAIVVLFNGFPHTGALARTATNIKVGALSPLAGIAKFGFKLGLAFFLAPWLEMVPMACIGGILLFVAVNMVKPAEVTEVWQHSRLHAGLMIYTAVMVAVTDFVMGVVSALIVWGVLKRFFEKPTPAVTPVRRLPTPAPVSHGLTVPFARPMVALSLSEPDEELLRYANLVLAQQRDAAVRFVHVLSPEADGSPARLQGVRDSLATAICRHAPDLANRGVVEVRQDARVDGLLRVAAEHEHDVIVLGHRRGRSGRRSMARRLALMAPSSVWLVPQGSPARLSRIVVPTDFSDHSADALEVATGIANQHGLGECTALHVRFDPSLSQYPEHADHFRAAEEGDFARFLSEVDTRGVQVVPVFEDSAKPAVAILRAADRLGADLLVMNTRGRSAAAAVLLGSVTSEVMVATHLPVLVVKHFGRQMSLREVLTSERFWRAAELKTA